ncbi:MAG TPA: hypothetical protein VLM40_02055, partial [Gemmata sp.]|nr:hypothetical protein [Gemmata sp.]
MRTRFWAAAAAIVVLAAANSALALVMAPNPPARRAIGADVVVVGKISSIQSDLVQAEPFPGAKQKSGYRVATVTIKEGLAGVGKIKEIKVGYIPPPKPNPNQPGRPGIRPIRGPLPALELKEGQELIFFLAKHPTTDFYVIPGMMPPVELKDEQGKKELEVVKKVTATLADPMKGLKSDKAETRAETAAIVISKYRSFPPSGGNTTEVAINADESKLLLKALLEGDWSNRGFRFDGPPSALMAFQSLALSDKDGWVQPIIVNAPGTPPID